MQVILTLRERLQSKKNTMKKITILGAGLVGGVMAQDLAGIHDVTSIDISQKNLDTLKKKKN